MGSPRHIQPVAPAQVADTPRMICYVSAADMAQLFHISESTVWEWAKKGVIPKPNNIGGVTRWKWADVQAHVDSGGQTGKDAGDDDPILRASRGR